MYQLKITRPGSLLSTIVDREISPAQVSIIVALLKQDDVTYGEALAFLASRPDRSDEDSVNGREELLGGRAWFDDPGITPQLAQYQRESR